jgi:hypothetical protein
MPTDKTGTQRFDSRHSCHFLDFIPFYSRPRSRQRRCSPAPPQPPTSSRARGKYAKMRLRCRVAKALSLCRMLPKFSSTCTKSDVYGSLLSHSSQYTAACTGTSLQLHRYRPKVLYATHAHMYICIQTADARGTQTHGKKHETFHGNIHWAQTTNKGHARACRKSGYIWADRDFFWPVCFFATLLSASDERSWR